MTRESIHPAAVMDTRTLGYSQVVRVTGPRTLLFVAGQTAATSDMKFAAVDIEGQTRAVFENIRLCLDAAGATMADIVTMTVYLHDIDNHKDPVRAVRSEFFEAGHEPVSTMIEVSKFAAEGILIEVDVIAALTIEATS
jgi:enamine deaminase RidA (YjgF/YER057c/UK114 family)